MKKVIVLTLALTAMLFSFSCKGKSDGKAMKSNPGEKAKAVDPMVAKTKKLAKEFMGHLVGKLKVAIKEKGAHGAISVCNTASPEAEEMFKGKNPDILSFRRITLKPRNAKDHTPTDAEKKALEEMEKSPAPKILKGEGKTTVLLPIVIKKDACLTCHGDTAKFPEKLKSALNEQYPDDKATGYSMKDLRGALAVEWKN